MKLNAQLLVAIVSGLISVLPVAALISLGSIGTDAPPAVACGGAALKSHTLSHGDQNFSLYATIGWSVTSEGLAVSGSDFSIPLASLRAVATHREVTRRNMVLIIDAEGNGFVGRVTDSGTTISRSVSYDGQTVTFNQLSNFVSGSRSCSPVTDAPGSW
jgi:hypothetical protein